jgi:hypothetical protein
VNTAAAEVDATVGGDTAGRMTENGEVKCVDEVDTEDCGVSAGPATADGTCDPLTIEAVTVPNKVGGVYDQREALGWMGALAESYMGNSTGANVLFEADCEGAGCRIRPTVGNATLCAGSAAAADDTL